MRRITTRSVVLGPRECAGVLAVLMDWSALGMVEPFVWLDPEAAVSGAGATGVAVVEGRVRGVVLQEAIPSDDTGVRLIALVPLADADHHDAASALLSSVQSSTQGRVLPIRLLLPRAASQGAPLLGRQGWHNLVVSPETARGPRNALIPLPLDDPDQLASHEAAVVAAIAGLWRGTPDSPLDIEQVPNGTPLNLCRAEVRSWEKRSADAALASATLTLDSGVPAALSSAGPVTYVPDDADAATRMAHTLWAQQEGAFGTRRLNAPAESRTSMGLLDFLKEFWSFLVGGLSNPKTWLMTRLDAAKSAAASRVGRVLLGEGSSIDLVWSAGETPPASALHTASADLLSRLSGQLDLPPLEPPGQFPDVWRDFVAGAMTLIDGQDRGALKAIRVGSQIGVVRQGAIVAPKRADVFTELDPSLDLEPELRRVEAVDILAQQRLLNDLGGIAGGNHQASAAMTSRKALKQWIDNSAAKTYAARVGAKLVERLEEHRLEVAELASQFTSADQSVAGQELVGRQRNLARLLRRVLLGGAGVAVLIATLGFFAVIALPLALAMAVGVIVVALAGCFWTFVKRQGKLFELLHQQRTVATQSDVMRENLRLALRDVNRCSDAYEQYLSWCRVLGEFIDRPFGQTGGQESEVRLPRDLPGNVRFGTLDYDATDVETIGIRLKERAFPVGWLDLPWRVAVAGAGQRLGPQGYRLTQNPKLLYQERSGVPESLLDRWANLVVSEGVGSAGGEEVWQQISKETLARTLAEVGVTGRVREGNGQVTDVADALDGLEQADVPGKSFAIELLDPQAILQNRNRVQSPAWVSTVSTGQGYQTVRVEFSDDLTAGDFTYRTVAQHDPTIPGVVI